MHPLRRIVGRSGPPENDRHGAGRRPLGNRDLVPLVVGYRQDVPDPAEPVVHGAERLEHHGVAQVRRPFDARELVGDEPALALAPPDP